MADLFGYTPTQSVVAPQSTRLNVQAPSSDAFQSIQGIINSALEMKKTQNRVESQQLQNEASLVSAQSQLQRQWNAEQEAKAKSQADAAKDQKKLEIANLKTQAATDVALRERNYNASVQAIQGNPELSEADKVSALRAFSQQYVAENDTLLQSLPNEVFSSVKDKVFSNSETAAKTFNDFLATVDKSNFETDMAIKTDSFIRIVDINSMKSSYKDEMTAAGASGITPKEFGDLQTDYVISNFRTALNSEDLEKTHNYQTLNDAQAFMLKYYGIDKRNRVKVEGFLKEIDDIRTKVDAAVLSSIKQASSIQNKPFFDSYLAHGLSNGAIQPDQANLLRAQYLKDGASVSELEQQEAERIMAKAGEGVPDYVTMTSNGIKTKVKTLVTDKLIQNLHTGELTPQFVEEFKRIDSKTFKDKASNDIDRKMRRIKDLSVQAQNEKDPQKAQALIQERDALFGKVQTNLRYIDSDLERSQAMMVEAYKTVVLSGNFENVQKAYELIGNPADVPNLKDSTLIEKITEDVSLDMQDEALKSAAILKASGYNSSEIYDIIKNTHSYKSYGDMSFQMSQKTHDMFVGNQISSKAVPYFEEAIRAEGSLGTSQKSIELRDSIISVLDGENPRVNMKGANLRFENDEGGLVELLMSPETWQSFKKELDARYDADNPAGTGLERWGYEASGSIAPKVAELSNAFADVAQVPIAVGRTAGEALDFDAIGTAISDKTASLNKMFDDWLYQEVPFGKAWDSMTERNRVIDNNFSTNYEEEKAKIWKEALERGEQGAKVLAGGIQAPEDYDYMENVKESFSAIDDGLNWLGDGLKAPEDADFGKEVSNLFDAAFKTLQNMLDFTVSSAEAADVLPATNVVEGQVLFNTTNFNKNIGRIAEGRHGYDSTKETYTPMLTNDASEKGKADKDKSSDIGYGHKIKQSEWDTGVIHGVKFWDVEKKQAIPLTEMQVLEILDADMSENLTGVLPDWNKKIKERELGNSFDDINPQAQAVLTSLAFNVGSEKAKQWQNIFNNFGLYYPSMSAEETAQFAFDLRRDDAGKRTKGTDNRVMKELVSAGLIKDKATYDAVVARLPLHDEFSTFASTR